MAARVSKAGNGSRIPLPSLRRLPQETPASTGGMIGEGKSNGSFLAKSGIRLNKPSSFVPSRSTWAEPNPSPESILDVVNSVIAGRDPVAISNLAEQLNQARRTAALALSSPTKCSLSLPVLAEDHMAVSMEEGEILQTSNCVSDFPPCSDNQVGNIALGSASVPATSDLAHLTKGHTSPGSAISNRSWADEMDSDEQLLPSNSDGFPPAEQDPSSSSHIGGMDASLNVSVDCQPAVRSNANLDSRFASKVNWIQAVKGSSKSSMALSYHQPSLRNGKAYVKPPKEVALKGDSMWELTAVGYFLDIKGAVGKTPQVACKQNGNVRILFEVRVCFDNNDTIRDCPVPYSNCGVAGATIQLPVA